MLTVRFIRHGESVANAGGVTHEPSEIPLTARGHDQVEALSRTFQHPPDLIVSSSYRRARQSAEPTLRRFPSVPFEIWPVHEIACLAPARVWNTTSTQRLPWVDEFWGYADIHRCDGKGAESYAEFVDRVRTALNRLSGLECEHVTMFSHGQFLNGVWWEINEGAPPVSPDTMLAFRAFHRSAPIENVRGFTAQWTGDAWRIA